MASHCEHSNAKDGHPVSIAFNPVSDKTIGRLSLYRRILRDVQGIGRSHIFSHELAALAGCTSAQVRRDIMSLGSMGSPAKGYEIEDLIGGIGRILDADEVQKVALAGVGNLGRAILAYFAGRSRQFAIVAAFDADPAKVNRVIHGCRCYPAEQLRDVVQAEGIRVGIIAVPEDAAQSVASAFCEAGVCGLMNFAPVPLRTPAGVYVENLDVMTALERIAYFARKTAETRGR